MTTKIQLNLFLLGVCLIVFSSMGCIVQSIYPFYTKQYIVEVPEIMGHWRLLKSTGSDVSMVDIRPWIFTDDKIASYDTDNRLGEFDAAYFKVNDTHLLDCTPNGEGDSGLNIHWNNLIFPVHTLCKIEIDEDLLRLVPLDYDYLIKLVQANEVGLSFLKVGQDEEEFHLFTAKSDEWIEFLKSHSGNERLFDSKEEFVFQRISE